MKNLLVVDDEEEVEFIFNMMFEEEVAEGKVKIDFFSNPIQCLELSPNTEMSQYDYILSDINMPHLNGIQFISKIRDNGYSGPAGFISAYSQDQYAEQMKQLSIKDFFSKPLNFHEIKTTLGF